MLNFNYFQYNGTTWCFIRWSFSSYEFISKLAHGIANDDNFRCIAIIINDVLHQKEFILFQKRHETIEHNMRETYREDGPRSLYQTSGQPAECPLDYESAVQAAYCDSRMSSV
ncbi:unnamed protein product [Onchocerca flexuosa]|uniref:CACTA en-spm transposon protein n=1 Tax=Onchocerca flexuosa TaxID=387005 RepID=A0A183HNJ1_9BILA|nr:unnamed protein product [Onchocerca flexuosa]